MVVGDSVSIGWTPVLSALINGSYVSTYAVQLLGFPARLPLTDCVYVLLPWQVVSHSPGKLADGGARSTSNFLNCHGYLLRTVDLQPLPLKSGDTMLMNFGLHDYNLGLAGVEEYTTELTKGIQLTKTMLPAGVKLIFVGTTPAHNTASVEDDVTVVALNVAAKKVCITLGVVFIDLYTPLIKDCGPVPWCDSSHSKALLRDVA